MKNQKFVLGIVLFVLGFTGVLSTLSMEMPMPAEAAAVLQSQFTPTQIRLLSLLNPTLMLIGAVLLGVFFHDKVGLDVPVIKGLIRKDKNYSAGSLVTYGIVGGFVSGILLFLTGILHQPVLPQEFKQLAAGVTPTLPVRFLYGGITEEILMRFGLMTFIIWLFMKVFKTVDAKIYWMGILLTALLFALGHLPVAFMAVADPSAVLISYILIGNSIGGIIFGWLYWKKGLEAAFLAHLGTHMVLVSGESLLKGWV